MTAKRERRRLERVWLRRRSEPDRIAYRAACRHANTVINSSRRDHIRQELDSCTDSRQRWTTVKRLLHSTDNKLTSTDSADIGLCEKFSDYFVSKITKLRLSISSRMSSQSSHQLPAEPTHSGPSLHTLPAVTPDEVSALLSKKRLKNFWCGLHTIFPTQSLFFCLF